MNKVYFYRNRVSRFIFGVNKNNRSRTYFIRKTFVLFVLNAERIEANFSHFSYENSDFQHNVALRIQWIFNIIIIFSL